MDCKLCPRECGAERSLVMGLCGAGQGIKCSRAALHFWEEPCISGERGSGAIFFAGCPLRCVYCQNAEISSGEICAEISPLRLSEIFRELEEQGAENINLVSPTPYVIDIIRALDIYRPSIPIVYNTGGYEKTETLELISPYIDIYLPDLKYVDTDIAQKYSGALDYPEKAKQAVLYMLSKKQNAFDERGVMQSGMIIRHLVLPSKVLSTYHVLDWLGENVPRDTYISLMGQYFPSGRAAQFPEINRKLTGREYAYAYKRAELNGFLNVYIQELSSASRDFVPQFDLSGVEKG